MFKSRHLLICCLGLPWLSAAPIPAQSPGRLCVLAIGVEPQLSQRGKNDPYSRDAGHIAAALDAARPLYRELSARVIQGNDATYRTVHGGLTELAASLQPDDVGVVFFSTHGGWSAEEGYQISLAKGPGGFEHLSARDLLQPLSQARGQVIVLLDTCCAAGVLPVNRAALPRVSFLVACRRDEGSSGSGPSKSKPHGCFVVAVVEALGGRGDADRNGIVTLAELEKYVPDRALELYNEQHAVSRIRPAASALALAKISPQSPPAPPSSDERVTRNPFGMPDINRPFGRDVQEFAKATRLPGRDDDENAAAWATESLPTPESIAGRWSGRWRSEGADWSTGQATVKQVDDRIFIMYHDPGARYLIEARRIAPQRLAGRYINLGDEGDTGPWVGRTIGNDRIDGAWNGGRWDFRRTVTE